MTPFQREQQRIKKEIDEKNAQLDASADSLLEKFRRSKYSGVIFWGAVLVAILILWGVLF